MHLLNINVVSPYIVGVMISRLVTLHRKGSLFLLPELASMVMFNRTCAELPVMNVDEYQRQLRLAAILPI